MKKNLFFVLVLVVSGLSFAQGGYKPYNQFSIETGLGYSMPMSGKSFDNSGSYSSFTNLELGARYMFNQNFGAKFNMLYNSFRESSEGVNHTRFMVSGFYNVGNLFDLTFKTYEAVALYMHAGVGMGYVKSTDSEIKGTDRQPTYAFGISPRFRITEKISIMTDVSYYGIVKQHMYYNGQRIEPFTTEGQNASHIAITVGLVFNLGNKRYHADWY